MINRHVGLPLRGATTGRYQSTATEMRHYAQPEQSGAVSPTKREVQRMSMGSLPKPGDQFISRLQQAKKNFESLQRAIADQRSRDFPTFADAVLQECARAHRIARDAPDTVRALGVDPDEFVGFMADVNQHRNVGDHWADAINPRKPKPHQHVSPDGLKIAVDETSVIVRGPTEIYKGKLNLYDVYCYIEAKLGQLAPGSSLPPFGTRTPKSAQR
jgi:hypothetical protein